MMKVILIVVSCLIATISSQRVCGNGVLEPGEDCDNDVNIPARFLDGCSTNCAVEVGWKCTGNIGSKSQCTPERPFLYYNDCSNSSSFTYSNKTGGWNISSGFGYPFQMTEDVPSSLTAYGNKGPWGTSWANLQVFIPPSEYSVYLALALGYFANSSATDFGNVKINGVVTTAISHYYSHNEGGQRGWYLKQQFGANSWNWYYILFNLTSFANTTVDITFQNRNGFYGEYTNGTVEWIDELYILEDVIPVNSTCGNGVLDEGEFCDNDINFPAKFLDGCSSKCEVEYAWSCENYNSSSFSNCTTQKIVYYTGFEDNENRTGMYQTGDGRFNFNSSKPYRGNTSLMANYHTFSSSYFVLPSIQLPNVPCVLQFANWFYTEARYDGGQILINNVSTNPMLGFYRDKINKIGLAFTGKSNGWEYELVDLTPWKGTTINISFYYWSDLAVSEAGWFIDELFVVQGSPPTVTSGSWTTQDLSTGQLTTSDISTGDLTTDVMTTGEMTTNDMTTDVLTTVDMKTDAMTTGMLTTDQVTTSHVTPSEVTTEEGNTGDDVTTQSENKQVTSGSSNEVTTSKEGSTTSVIVVSLTSASITTNNESYVPPNIASPSSEPSEKKNTGLIVGLVLGAAVLGTVGAATAAFFVMKNKKKKLSEEGLEMNNSDKFSVSNSSALFIDKKSNGTNPLAI